MAASVEIPSRILRPARDPALLDARVPEGQDGSEGQEGSRHYRRLKPTPDRPARVSVVCSDSRGLKPRTPDDLSLGGVGFLTRSLESRRLAVGDDVVVCLTVLERRVRIPARVCHIRHQGPGLFGSRSVGLAFDLDRAPVSAGRTLARYLSGLARDL